MADERYLSCFGDLLAKGCTQTAWSDWVCLAKDPIRFSAFDLAATFLCCLAAACILHECAFPERVQLLVRKIYSMQHEEKGGGRSVAAALVESGAFQSSPVPILVLAWLSFGVWALYLYRNCHVSATENEWIDLTPRSWFWILPLSSPTLVLNLAVLNTHGHSSLLPRWYRICAYSLHSCTLVCFLVQVSAHLSCIVSLLWFTAQVVFLQSLFCIPFTLVMVTHIGWMKAISLDYAQLPAAFEESARSIAGRYFASIHADVQRLFFIDPLVSKSCHGVLGLLLFLAFPVVHFLAVGVLGGLWRAVCTGSMTAYALYVQSLSIPALCVPWDTLTTSRLSLLLSFVLPFTILDTISLVARYFPFSPRGSPGGETALWSRGGSFLCIAVHAITALRLFLRRQFHVPSHRILIWKERIDTLYSSAAVVCAASFFLPWIVAYWEQDQARVLDGWIYYATPLFCGRYLGDLALGWGRELVFGLGIAGFTLGLLFGRLSSLWPWPSPQIMLWVALSRALQDRDAPKAGGEQKWATEIAALGNASNLETALVSCLESCREGVGRGFFTVLADLEAVEDILDDQENDFHSA